MPLIHTYFYAPNDTDHIINRIVTAYDPPFSHCDVQFEDTMASSIYSGEKVYWRKRGFKKPGYSRITLSADAPLYAKAYALCQERAERGVEFDAFNMYTLPLLPAAYKKDRPNHTFCSKHCTEVLQLAGVRSVLDLDPKMVTPSMLFQVLQKNAVLHTDSINLRIVHP